VSLSIKSTPRQLALYHSIGSVEVIFAAKGRVIIARTTDVDAIDSNALLDQLIGRGETNRPPLVYLNSLLSSFANAQDDKLILLSIEAWRQTPLGLLNECVEINEVDLY